MNRLLAVSMLSIVSADPVLADHAVHPDTLAGALAVDTARLMGSPSPLPPYRLEVAFPNLKFDRPLVFTHAGDGTNRVFVATQRGEVFVFPNERDIADAKLFLDIRGRVKSPASGGQNEEGLMGVAFHPRYRENGELFVYYTRKPMHSVIARFRVSSDDADKADPDFEERLFELEQPYWNHNGGVMQFGPDGKLYIAFGDGGAGGDPHGNGQNLGSYYGSLIRIDVDAKDPGKPYAVPKDNPFVGREGALPEIWAYGLRNPWGITFDRKTGELWLADVGQDIWEEVDIIQKGGNYGWKLREGNHAFAADSPAGPDPLIDPVWEFHHDYGKSITGGVVYRGPRLPELDGWYLCTDFVSMRFWLLRWDGQRIAASQEIAASPSPISAMGEAADGEAYITAFDGQIYRLARSGEPSKKHPPFPTKLSATGLFASTKDLAPAPGLIPYSVNVPLWSDGAGKERYIALPAQNSVKFREKTSWDFPVGTVLVKTFFLDGEPRRRLETRLMVHSPEQGWVGYTYRWNDDETDAALLDASERATFAIPESGAKGGADGGGAESAEWYFPSRQDCMTCHTKTAGFVLGINTRQANRSHAYGERRHNQIEMLAELGLFSQFPDEAAESMDAYPDWDSESDQTEKLVRAYLDVNCAMCHAPGGSGNSKLDLRYHTPIAESFLLAEGAKVRGRPGPRIVMPGEPDVSELIRRMARRGPGQMPAMASNIADGQALDLLRRWIGSLED